MTLAGWLPRLLAAAPATRGLNLVSPRSPSGGPDSALPKESTPSGHWATHPHPLALPQTSHRHSPSAGCALTCSSRMRDPTRPSDIQRLSALSRVHEPSGT